MELGHCEETSGLPCEDGGELELPDGDAVIIGNLDPGSILNYTDPDGEAFTHEVTHTHQLLAIGDGQGNTALLIIGPDLDYTDRGIVG